MAIVTFWNELKQETGQTGTAIAVATQLAIEHNYKILLLTTQFNNNQIENSFWDIGREKKSLLSFLGPQKNVALDSGINGLTKTLSSNKLTPQVITNYTRIVFKNRLEVLSAFKGDILEFEKVRNLYSDLITAASQYYDLVMIDLEKGLDIINKVILDSSDLIVYGLNQRNSTIEHFIKSKTDGYLADKKNVVAYVGKHDKFSKYNAKNMTRYIKQKDPIVGLTYNTLFFEASNEGEVADFFLKMKTVKREDDRNVQFIQEVKSLSDNILYKLQELQMKM